MKGLLLLIIFYTDGVRDFFSKNKLNSIRKGNLFTYPYIYFTNTTIPKQLFVKGVLSLILRIVNNLNNNKIIKNCQRNSFILYPN